MKLPVKVKVAIKNYFRKKYAGGDGMFAPGEKEKALALLDEACTESKLGLTVVPGLVCIGDGKKVRYYNSGDLRKYRHKL